MKKFEDAKISNQELAKVSGGNGYKIPWRIHVHESGEGGKTVEPFTSYEYCLNDDNSRFAANFC